jgi:hypothetical protein
LLVLSKLNHGAFASSDQIRDLVKAFNMALTTTVLDAIAPDPGPDGEVISEWCQEVPDETMWYEEEPEGPREPPVDPAAMMRVQKLLERVITKTRFEKRKRVTTVEGTVVQ